MGMTCIHCGKARAFGRAHAQSPPGSFVQPGSDGRLRRRSVQRRRQPVDRAHRGGPVRLSRPGVVGDPGFGQLLPDLVRLHAVGRRADVVRHQDLARHLVLRSVAPALWLRLAHQDRGERQVRGRQDRRLRAGRVRGSRRWPSDHRRVAAGLRGPVRHAVCRLERSVRDSGHPGPDLDAARAVHRRSARPRRSGAGTDADADSDADDYSNHDTDSDADGDFNSDLGAGCAGPEDRRVRPLGYAGPVREPDE